MTWASVAGAVAGGLSAGGSGGTVDNTPQFAPEVQPFIAPALANVTGSNADVQNFQAPFGAAQTANQQASLAGTSQVAQGLDRNADIASQGFQAFAGGDFIQGGNPEMDDIIAALQDSAQRNFDRNTNPAITNNAIAAGGVGGSRQGIAQGLALSDMNRQLIDAEANLRGNQFNQDTSNMLSALQNQGQILSNQTAGSNFQLQQGTTEQALNQNDINFARQQFDDQANSQFNRDFETLALLLGSPTGSSTTAPSVNPLTGAIGGALTANQLFPGTASPAAVPASASGFNPFTQGAGLTTANSLL